MEKGVGGKRLYPTGMGGNSLPTLSFLEQWGRSAAVTEELFARVDTEDRQIAFSFLVWDTMTNRYLMESHNLSARELSRK